MSTDPILDPTMEVSTTYKITEPEEMKGLEFTFIRDEDSLNGQPIKQCKWVRDKTDFTLHRRALETMYTFRNRKGQRKTIRYQEAAVTAVPVAEAVVGYQDGHQQLIARLNDVMARLTGLEVERRRLEQERDLISLQLMSVAAAAPVKKSIVAGDDAQSSSSDDELAYVPKNSLRHGTRALMF